MKITDAFVRQNGTLASAVYKKSYRVCLGGVPSPHWMTPEKDVLEWAFLSRNVNFKTSTNNGIRRELNIS